MFANPVPRPTARRSATHKLTGSLAYWRTGSVRQDTENEGRPYRLQFASYSFDAVLAQPVAVMVNHLAAPIGMAVLSETKEELCFEMALEEHNPHHRRVLNDLKHGLLTGFSPTFLIDEIVLDGERDGVSQFIVASVAGLKEISICRSPTKPCFDSSLFLFQPK